MIYQLVSDPMEMLSNHVLSLQSLANLRGITITVENGLSPLIQQKLDYKYLTEFVLLISRIIEQAPTKSEIIIYPNSSKGSQDIWCSVQCQNILSPLPENLTHGLDIEIAHGSYDEGTRINILYPIVQVASATTKAASLASIKTGWVVKPFYQQLRRQLRSHSTSMKSLEERATHMSSEDGTFLSQLNAVILANLDNSLFDASSLCRSLMVSRPQLYRKLKPLVGFSPGAYIRYIRLNKAKEMLENTNRNIGDVAFEVGYPDQSHFTRAFKKQFGFHPSYYRHKH